MNTKVKIAGVEFKNPILTASGTYGFGWEYSRFYDISALGGVCTKGVTREKRLGNLSPRIAETPSGILNSVGLQNPGVDAFIEDDLPFLLEKDLVTVVNIAGSTEEDYKYVAEKVSATGAHMVELNISCPNVKAGGMAFGIDPQSVGAITESVKEVCKKPLIVKLSPNVSDIAANAKAAEDGGADAVSLINTVTGMAIDRFTRKPVLANVTGGLSVPCVKPIALRMVHEVYKKVNIPIIGLGGIMTGADVMEFMIAGATAVQVGSANIFDPMAAFRIVNELTKEMECCKIHDVNELIGSLITQ